MTARSLVALVVVTVAASCPLPAKAQLQFSGERPRIFSIQKRPFQLGHEFQLGLAVLPLDAFYIGLVLAGSYTYHFSDLWAWEIVGLGYSRNFDTGLTERLKTEFGVEPQQQRGEGQKINFFGTTSLVAKPLFGKLTLFNEDIVFSETFFSLGVGPFVLGDDERPDKTWAVAVSLGLGFRFWSTDAISVRVDIRDYLVFLQAIPENSLMFMLSAAINVYEPEEEPLPATGN